MKSRFPAIAARLILPIALAAVCAGPTFAASEEAFREGVGLYLRGRTEEALEKFKEVLAENPSHEEAYRYFEQSGREVFFLMLVKDGEYEAVAKRFLELARMGRKEKVNDVAAITALVDQALGGNYIERREAIARLSADHGEFGAAPFIAELANDEDRDRRVNAIFSLTRMSGDSVLPLCAALASDNDMVVTNAAACLGAIGDDRAVPALQRVYENASSDQVRGAANDAIHKITGKSAASLPSSTDLHLVAAEQYFRADEAVVSPFDTKDAIWSLNGSSVEPEMVPDHLRSLKLAEQHCFAAVHDRRGRALLMAVYSAQGASMQAAAMAEGSEADAEAMMGLATSLLAGGGAELAAGLDFALSEGRPAAALGLIEAMQLLGDEGAARRSLQNCLANEYKSVRYGAAQALVALGDVSRDVVATLGQALGEDAVRTVLVVDDNANTRNALQISLTEAGYSVVVADNGGTGFLRSRSNPPKDVIIVRASMADVTVDQFVYDSDFRAAASPILILASAEAAETVSGQYEGRGKVAGFLVEPLGETLIESVEAAFSDLNNARDQAQNAARGAARTLAGLSADQLAPARNDLVAALGNADEEVLVATLKALSKVGPTGSEAVVAAIFSDEGKSEAVRAAAADALGGIFASLATHPGADVVDPVANAALSDASAPVRMAAARALGRAAFLSDEDRAALLSNQRGN